MFMGLKPDTMRHFNTAMQPYTALNLKLYDVLQHSFKHSRKGTIQAAETWEELPGIDKVVRKAHGFWGLGFGV